MVLVGLCVIFKFLKSWAWEVRIWSEVGEGSDIWFVCFFLRHFLISEMLVGQVLCRKWRKDLTKTNCNSLWRFRQREWTHKENQSGVGGKSCHLHQSAIFYKDLSRRFSVMVLVKETPTHTMNIVFRPFVFVFPDLSSKKKSACIWGLCPGHLILMIPLTG